MRGIKPLKLTFITRPFSWGQSHQLGVAVMAYFPLTEPTLLTDMELWTEVPEQLGKDFVLDVGIPKSRSEFLLAGSAHQPGGEPAPLRFVRVKVGELTKTLNVVGDRTWVDDVPTEPEPFVTMPLTWSHAFGGEGFDQNPEGKGAHAIEVDGHEVLPLPNVELPGSMVSSQRDRPTPAGFGPIDFMRPSRSKLVGTYDKRWLETRFPGYAEDLDWRIWNVAPEDQWQDEPFRGDEAVVLEHLHPEKPKLEGGLPGVRGRCFVQQRRGEELELFDVPLKLTTIWLLPNIERGIAIFHGAHPIAEDDGADIETIMIAAEHLDRPKPFAHYEDVLARRLGDNAVFEALNEQDLMPEGMDGLGTAMEEAEKLTTIEQLRLKRKVAVANERIAKTRADIAALGLDPDEHGPSLLEPPPETPSLKEMPQVLEDAMKKHAEAQVEAEKSQKEIQERVQALCAATGMDQAMLEAEMTTPPHGPPNFSADGNRHQLRHLADQVYETTGERNDELEHWATDPELYEQWTKLEAQGKDGYRMGAHFQSAAPAAPANASAERRAMLEAAYARGESLADWDLTGVDLSGVNLRGADLSRSFLESADLSAATLDGARLDDAVLARAKMRGASLVGASLRRANVGMADLSGATCRGADFSEAILLQATLRSVDLSDANLTEASFEGESDLADTKLLGCRLIAARFQDMSLSGLDFSGADLTYATFYKVDARGVSFAGAILEDATFYQCRGDGAVFTDARMKRFRSVESHFPGADFKRAVLDEACMRENDLEKADLSGARLRLADLSGARLAEAILYRIVAPQSMWVRTDLQRAQMISADLFEAILQKANIRSTDLRGANLYGADLSLVHSDAGTTVEEAIQDRVRYLPLRQPPEESP